MNTRSFRSLTAPLAAVALAAALTGCSALDSLGGGAEPAQRDEPGGEITASAEADVFSLQLGDCLDYAGLSEMDQVESVPTIPCGDPHDAEIYAETTITEDQLADVETIADTFCRDSFTTFIGKTFDESLLGLNYLYPDELTFAEGDDVIQCIVQHPDGGVTGTLKDSAI